MEIVLKNITINKNDLSSIEYDHLNMVFEDNNIVGVIGEELGSLIDLLTLNFKNYSGDLIFGGITIRKNTKKSVLSDISSKISFVSFDCCELVVNRFISGLSKNSKNDHMINSLKIVGLDEAYLKRKYCELSSIEQKKVALAKVLYNNPEVIIIRDFFKGMCFRDREYFRKLLIKFRNKYNKTIIVIDSINNLFDLVDKFYVINSGSIVYEGQDYYNNDIYKYIDIPKIVEFTKYAHEMGHNILEYTDIKELLKELYRHVG